PATKAAGRCSPSVARLSCNAMAWLPMPSPRLATSPTRACAGWKRRCRSTGKYIVRGTACAGLCVRSWRNSVAGGSLRSSGFTPRAKAHDHEWTGKVIDDVHTGEQYHQFMLASPRDRLVRDRFQKLALALLPAGAAVLDFGAGTGIDAKVYAAAGHPTFVHDPSAAMGEYLTQYCRDEIARKTIVTATLPLTCTVHAVTANFAVLNHFADHTGLFEGLSQVVQPGGFVLANMLNPYCLGDARYGWWRANVM